MRITFVRKRLKKKSEKCKCKTRVLLNVLNLYVRDFTYIAYSLVYSYTYFLGLHESRKKSCKRCNKNTVMTMEMLVRWTENKNNCKKKLLSKVDVAGESSGTLNGLKKTCKRFGKSRHNVEKNVNVSTRNVCYNTFTVIDG